MIIRSLHALYQQRADHGGHGHGKGRCDNKSRRSDEDGSHSEHHGEHCCHHSEHDRNHSDRKGCHGEHSRHNDSRGCHHEGRGHRGRGCANRGKSQGRQLKRMFDHGDLRVLLLSMIATKPSHGYEIIREIDEASSGLYVPSPGVIYPTLTLLEEQDLVVANIAEKGRKNYSITSEGTQFLAEHQEIEKNIQSKLAYARELSQNAGGVSEEIESAVGKLKAVLRHKLVLNELSVEKAGRIASILNEAVEQIEAINEALISEENDDE